MLLLLLSKEVYETSHVAIANEDDSTLAAVRVGAERADRSRGFTWI